MAAIVQNTGTNYTLYYNVLNYFKTIMNNHPSIAQVSQGEIVEIDDIQFPFYPIGNILITNSVFGTSVTEFTIQLIVADKIKNKNNESEGERNKQIVPFFGVDDTVDIHANTLAILNDLISYTQRGVAGFEINGDINCTPFADRFNNGLAGWQAEFTLTTHNDKNRCLFFLTSPSGSGYVIEECTTGQRYNTVLSGSVSTGSVFHSYYPTRNSCYSVVSPLTDFDNWDLVNLPVQKIYDICEACEFCKTGDIVRDGLIMAYDWTSFNSDGTLTDRSSNGITANWYGNLTLSSNALQFDGTSSFITFPTASVNPLATDWEWTIDTYADLVYVNNNNTEPTGGWVSNIIAANYGNNLTIGATSSSVTPVWSWGIYSSSVGTSSDTNFMLRSWNQLFRTAEYNYTASAATYNQYSYLGKLGTVDSQTFPTASFVTQSVNANYLLNQSGSGYNNVPWRTFKSNGAIPTSSTNGQLVFGGPIARADFRPGVPVYYNWNPISGSVQYILYYNRPLSEAELEQNNKFYYCNNPITPGTTTTTTTTTTAAPTTTTTSTTSTTSTTTTTTLATGPLKLYEIFIPSGLGPGRVYYADCNGAEQSFNMNNNGGPDARVRIASKIVPYGPTLNVSDLGATTCGICYNVTIVGGAMSAFSCNSSGTGSFDLSLTAGQTGCVKATGQSSGGAAQWSWGSQCNTTTTTLAP